MRQQRYTTGAKAAGQAREVASWTQASLLSVGSSLRSAGSSLVTGLKAGYEQLTLDHSDKERVMFVRFGRLEYQQRQRGQVAGQSNCSVLLLGYETGFQIWDLRKTPVRELASRRETPVRYLEPMPLPNSRDGLKCPFLHAWPCVAVVADAAGALVSKGDADSAGSVVNIFSLQTHSNVHSIHVPGRVLSVCCSQRVVLVAMRAQIMAYDLGTLEMTYSAVTYPAPSLQPNDRGTAVSSVPLALGPRWLAHASNQAVHAAGGYAVSQSLSSGGARNGTPVPHSSTYEAAQYYAAQAARSSGKQIKNLGEASYKYLSTQMETWRAGSQPPSPLGNGSSSSQEDAEIVGTVMVRDMVTRSMLVHFRAHTSPLQLLQFDGSGTLLVTASVHGHTINIFHVCPGSPAGGGGEGPSPGSAVHLFRLSRGVTPAVIQDVNFSASAQWLCVSSARGTTHVFRLSLPGKEEALPPHLAAAAAAGKGAKQQKPVKLTAVGRVRRKGFLNGSIPGAAAASAAVNLYNGTSSSGMVASTFLPWKAGEGSNSQDLRSPAVDEDLCVVSTDGTLTRHRLSMATPASPSTQAYNASHTPPDSPASRDRKDESASELTLEAVEQWDVCRRRSWPEREELVAEAAEAGEEEAGAGSQQPWMVYAETCLHASGSVPLWADSQFHILEMQTSQQHSGSLHERQADSSDGEGQSQSKSVILQVEEVPTKRVNLQGRSGLAPVIIEGAQTAVLRGPHLGPATTANATDNSSS